MLQVIGLGIAAVERELMLVKVKADSNSRGSVFDLVQVFRAKVVDVADEASPLIVGDPGKLVALEQLLRPFGILNAHRKVALQRASGVNTETLKLQRLRPACRLRAE